MSPPDETWPDPSLEPAVRQFIESPAAAPHYLALPPVDARAAFARLQSSPIGKPSARMQDAAFPVGPTGSVGVRIVRPSRSDGPLPVLIYCHGGGWVGGDVNTHDRLIREVAVGAHVAVVFVNFVLAPEAPYPVAIEQVYAASLHVAAHADALDLDIARMAIAGDGTGGAIAAAVALMARERRGPTFSLQVLICPVTDATLTSRSCAEFAEGAWLTRAAMQRAWDAYLPDTSRRQEVTASPLRASLAQLAHLPSALVIVAECDVARDEGEAYAQQLSDAGVRVTSVRYNGTIHDFVVLNVLADTPATRAAIGQIIAALSDVFS